MRRLALVAAFVFLSCTPRVPEPTPRPTPTPTPSPVAVPSPSPTPTRTPGPSTEPVVADVDGDRKPDVVTLVPDEPGLRPKTHLQVVLATGATLRLDVGPALDPQVALAADADGIPGDELFVRVDEGASTEAWILVSYEAGALVRVTSADDPDLRFEVFGSVTHGDGFECATAAGGEHDIVVYALRDLAGETGVSAIRYAFAGKRLVVKERTSGPLTEAAKADPRYYTASCAGSSIR